MPPTSVIVHILNVENIAGDVAHFVNPMDNDMHVNALQVEHLCFPRAYINIQATSLTFPLGVGRVHEILQLYTRYQGWASKLCIGIGSIPCQGCHTALSAFVESVV